MVDSPQIIIHNIRGMRRGDVDRKLLAKTVRDCITRDTLHNCISCVSSSRQVHVEQPGGKILSALLHKAHRCPRSWLRMQPSPRARQPSSAALHTRAVFVRCVLARIAQLARHLLLCSHGLCCDCQLLEHVHISRQPVLIL